MSNDEKLKGWNKQVMFGGAISSKQEVKDAVLYYLLRSLSRGRIPDAGIAMAALAEKTPIPSCGYINCFMTDVEHVH